MIIYIHGFGSSGEGGKSRQFRDYFKEKGLPFIAPSLSYVPELAISTLEELIASYDNNVSLIGSSLGGYYSIYLAEKYGLNAALINPAVRSAETLKRAMDMQGLARNYYDESRFEWKVSHLEMLEEFRVDKPQFGNYMILVQKGDDVLNYNEVIEKIPQAQKIIEEDGSHAFDNVERHFEKVANFL